MKTDTLIYPIYNHSEYRKYYRSQGESVGDKKKWVSTTCITGVNMKIIK